MTTTQRIIKEPHIMGAISEQTALNAKEVAELADTKQAHARLCELRDQGLVIASSRTGKNKYWLTLAGVQYAEKMEESKQDQSNDANLNQANNASENSELIDATLINEVTSQANSDDNGFQYPIYKILKSTGEKFKFTEENRACKLFDNGWGIESEGYGSHTNAIMWQDWTLPEAETAESTKIDPVIVENVEAFNRMDEVAVKRETPPPQYNPDDVSFKKPDISESWYVVDGIDAQFETSSDAIAAAHDYVATHTMSTTVHIVASRKFAIIKPVVTTELEYL